MTGVVVVVWIAIIAVLFVDNVWTKPLLITEKKYVDNVPIHEFKKPKQYIIEIYGLMQSLITENISKLPIYF